MLSVTKPKGRAVHIKPDIIHHDADQSTDKTSDAHQASVAVVPVACTDSSIQLLTERGPEPEQVAWREKSVSSAYGITWRVETQQEADDTAPNENAWIRICTDMQLQSIRSKQPKYSYTLLLDIQVWLKFFFIICQKYTFLLSFRPQDCSRW